MDGEGSLVVAQASIPKVFSRYRIEPLRLEQQWFGDCDYSPSGWGDARDPRTVYCSMGSGFIRATVKGDGSNAYPDAYWDFEMMGYPVAFWGFGNTMQIPDNFIGPHGIHFMYAGAAEGPKLADGILRVEGDRMIPVGYVRNLGRAQATKDGPVSVSAWSCGPTSITTARSSRTS